MIIQTGMRTDIPAFYSEWFANRIKEGYVLVRNPYNPSQVTRYSLDSTVVDLIAFCSKNPEPMLKYMNLLKDYGMYWFVTITPYGKDIEPMVPEKEKVIETFRQISSIAGVDSMAWRYDPIFIDEKYSYILLPILSLLILSSRSFTHGGSCEELAFPMIIFTIYHFLKFLKTDYISNKEIFEIGITAGLIIWMKYTIIGFHIGFAFILLAKRIKAHNYKELAKNICFFFLGILITTIPWLIYFGIRKDGLKSLIDVYFLFNMNSYAEKSTMISKLLNCFKTIVDVLLKYYQYIILIIIPIFIFS